MTRGRLQLSRSMKTIQARRGAFFAFLLAALVSVSLSGCVGLSGDKTPPTAPQLVVTPNSISFQNVIVGQKNTQSIQISNTGTADLDIAAISLTGTGFSLGSVAAPLKLAPNASKNFTVSFTASSITNSAKATISIASSDTTSPLTVPVNASTVKANPAWQLTPAVVAFSGITVQGTKSQNVTLSNTGNVPMTINATNITGASFSMSGATPGTTIPEGKQLAFQVTFHPAAAGSTSGSLKLTSSIGTTLTMNLSGVASTASTPSSTPHAVTLTWDPSTSSSVAGYRVYRGNASGGPYFGLSSSLDSSTSFVDSSVVSGGKYFYVATAVDTSGNESAFSNEASATVPNP